MIGTTFNGIPTPPIPGRAPAQGAQQQPPAIPTPPVPGQTQAAPQQPPVVTPGPATAPPPVTAYWAVAGQSFHTLAQAGQAMSQGQLMAPAPNGDVKAQKLVWADTAQQKAFHGAECKRLTRNAIISFVGGMVAGALFPPLGIAGTILAMMNGYQAYNEHQAAQASPAPGYIVAEQGRIKASPATQPLPYTYEAVDPEHFGNIVPGHPFFHKPAVNITQAG
ncbi:MAG: hypothetical protein FJX76_02720 [Armatimonadetes bacterium]|nr:hypothetical protein [Armatimonadota bacterium]